MINNEIQLMADIKLMYIPQGKHKKKKLMFDIT
jgi:hypothetical protein